MPRPRPLHSEGYRDNAQLPPSASSASPTSPASQPPQSRDQTSTTPPRPSSFFADLTSPRSTRQFSLFLLGSTLFVSSALLTKRSLNKRSRLLAGPRPQFHTYTPNPHINLFRNPNHAFDNLNNPTANTAPSGIQDAITALGLATLNVFSVGAMFVGGMLWTFDIASKEELRQRVRGSLGIDEQNGRSQKEADEEIEEWLAGLLLKKDDKEKNKPSGEKGAEAK
ncbi:hypothetical protein K402DRAFT_396292 [Aulographum hederae CBS 113979]|uniref:Altered inheritance of mitochondria protein 11 n=1 Tax=Aulographum hederae CBS 113979 TaxID=1176131 RepID=A0A6G1GSR2_9PEZI|nr:hypothetical protein K402DRAFT_396292 [Aulographum hederae CBS 113979]